MSACKYNEMTYESGGKGEELSGPPSEKASIWEGKKKMTKFFSTKSFETVCASLWLRGKVKKKKNYPAITCMI